MNFLSFERQGHIVRLTFNRPEVFNAMHTAMRREVLEVLDTCAEDESVRVVYITGAGKAFCAGQDLQEIVDPNGPELSDILSKGYNPIVEKIRTLKKPVLAAVNGVAAGAGANIALACDITVAAENASFTQAFSKIGLIPDSGGTWTLPRLVGMQRALGLALFSEKITAQEAERLGLIWKVLPADTFMEESWRMAEVLSALPPKALEYTKIAMNASWQNDFSAQLKVEDTYQTLAGQSDDYQEGVRAFLEKRKPVFTGR
jgi:2-(1,2-epoxy-1,2-dihydrophenyl)acetyl-CoA isomerase